MKLLMFQADTVSELVQDRVLHLEGKIFAL